MVPDGPPLPNLTTWNAAAFPGDGRLVVSPVTRVGAPQGRTDIAGPSGP